MIAMRWRQGLSLLLAVGIVLSMPGVPGMLLYAQETATQYDEKSKTISVAHVTMPKVDDVITKLNDPKLQQRVSKDQLGQMQQFLKNFKGSFKGEEESPDAKAAIDQLARDLDSKDKDIGLSLSEAFDRLSPIARKST